MSQPRQDRLGEVMAAAIADVPTGRWCVGVSGGCDSVALLRLLIAKRPDLDLIVAHLDHEVRGDESLMDAHFVRELSKSLGLACRHTRRSDVLPGSDTSEAALRRARFAWFAKVVAQEQALGVLLGHHADDRVETALLRLLRGGEPSAIGGLRREATVDGILIHRPLLGVRRADLERYLRDLDQFWREDSSNTSDVYARNRVREFLRDRPKLTDPLLRLADAADHVGDWLREITPALVPTFPIGALGDLPDPVARRAARRWLIARGVPRDEAGGDAARALIDMCRDRATAGRRDFAGSVRVERKRGVICGRR